MNGPKLNLYMVGAPTVVDTVVDFGSVVLEICSGTRSEDDALR